LDKLRLYILSRFGEEATEKCFFDIQELIIKTLIATCKVMVNDKRCFELYGYDIMLDSTLKPWLIEVNGSPSMTANTPIDRNLKNGLLDDTLTIVNLEKL
jgi:tubulin polyglutamylase TTLL9